MSDVPPDLVEEILSRVPATALSRFRSTCKQWNILFKDKRFTKKHIDRAPKQFLILMVNKSRVSSLSLNLHGIDHDNIAAPFIEFKGELSLKDFHSSSSEQVDIFHVFHCDGLLLCNTKNDRLMVWNPCTGETKWIIPSNHYYKFSMFALGYENKKSSCRNYKLLRYRYNHNSNHPVVEFEIYEFTTGSWRFLNVTANFFLRSYGVSLKGNTYWPAFENYILCFDFSTETLGRLDLPFQHLYSCTTVLSTIRDEQLSVLHNGLYESKAEIWVTTNDKNDHTFVLSWRKLLAIDLYDLFSRRFSSSGWFFIDEEKKVVVFFDSGRIDKTDKNMVCVIGEHGVYREIHFGESIEKSGRAIIFNYVPSLVQIQQSTRQKLN